MVIRVDKVIFLFPLKAYSLLQSDNLFVVFSLFMKDEIWCNVKGNIVAIDACRIFDILKY